VWAQCRPTHVLTPGNTLHPCSRWVRHVCMAEERKRPHDGPKQLGISCRSLTKNRLDTPGQEWEFQTQRFAAKSVSWYKWDIIRRAKGSNSQHVWRVSRVESTLHATGVVQMKFRLTAWRGYPYDQPMSLCHQPPEVNYLPLFRE